MEYSLCYSLYKNQLDNPNNFQCFPPLLFYTFPNMSVLTQIKNLYQQNHIRILSSREYISMYVQQVEYVHYSLLCVYIYTYIYIFISYPIGHDRLVVASMTLPNIVVKQTINSIGNSMLPHWA
jgi:hypothetical protein